MPFYEYQCAACGHHHEELQKVTDQPLRKCPACSRTSLKRLVSAPVFRLKGGGWYETDFKHEKEEKRNLAGEKEPPAEKPKEDKPKDDKTQAKPAETPAEKPAEFGQRSPATNKPGKARTPARRAPARKPARRRARR